MASTRWRSLRLVAGAVLTLAAVVLVREEYLRWERHRATINAQPPASVPAGGLIFTGNQESSSVSVFDVESGRIVASIPVPEGPHELTASPGGRWVVASLPGDAGGFRPPWHAMRQIAVIDASAAKVHRVIDLAPHGSPHGVVFVDGRVAAVTSKPTQSVVFVDVESGALLGAVDVSSGGGVAEPHMLAISADRRRIYSANILSRTVSEIDAQLRTLVRQIPFAGFPVIAEIAHDGMVWAIEEGDGSVYTVAVVDPASGSVVARLTDAGMPRRIGMSPDGATAIVSDPGRDEIQIYDARTRVLRARVRLGAEAGPSGVSFSPDSARAFVAVSAGRVAEVDLATGRVVRDISAADGRPDGIVYVRR